MRDGEHERDDEILARARELDAARDHFTRLANENGALRKKLGMPGPHLSLPASAAPEHGASGYRSRTRLLVLERDLAETNTAIANLEIDNAILVARTGSRVRSRPGLVARVASAAALLALGGALWLVTGNVALLPVTVFLGGLTWGLVILMDSIKPDGSNRRDPPYFPPPAV